MAENDPYSWPGRLYEWLHEQEGYALRSERLMDDIEQGDYKRMIQWIKAAYELGRDHATYDHMLLYSDDGK